MPTARMRNNILIVLCLTLCLTPYFAAASDNDDVAKSLVNYLNLLENQTEDNLSNHLLRFLSAQKDYTNADLAPKIKQILDKNPGSVFARYQLGVIYAGDITKYQEALAEFRQGIQICQAGKPELAKYIPFFNYRLASLQLMNGQYQEALELLEQLKKEINFPCLAQVYNKAGVACCYQDLLYEAADNFKIALMIDSKYAEAKFNLKSLNLKLEHFNAGRVYLRMQQYREAEAEFSKAVEQNPNLAMARHFLGLACAYQNQPDKAIREYERVIAIAPHYQSIHDVYNLLGSAYISLAFSITGNEELKNSYLKKGIAAFKTALGLKPEFSEARKNLENVYQTLDLAAFMEISHLEAAREYLEAELFPQAVEEFNKLQADHPLKTAAILGWVKNSCCGKRDYSEVITICHRFLPDIKDQHVKDLLTLFLGYAYMQKGAGWYDKAEAELKKVSANPQANYYLGLIYLNQKQFAQSLAEFQRARESDLDNPEYFFILAKLHFYLENYDLAKRLLQISLEKASIQMERTKADSPKHNYLCEHKDIYERDLAFLQQEISHGRILPSDMEHLGLLVNSDKPDQAAGKTVYQSIKRYMEKQAGPTIADYNNYAALKAERLIPEVCTDDACLAEYSRLTNSTKLLLVDIDQLTDRLIIAFSLYHPELKRKESICEQEFQGTDVYEAVKKPLETVADFFKKQRAKTYCELCPQM